MHERAVRSGWQLLVDAVQSIDEGVVDVDGLQERYSDRRAGPSLPLMMPWEVMAELDQPADADDAVPWFGSSTGHGVAPGRLYLLAGESGRQDGGGALHLRQYPRRRTQHPVHQPGDGGGS